LRWFAYIVLAYVALSLQVGLGGFLAWRGASPNFVLIATVFIAINAPRVPALLGCFVLGLLQDLLSQQPPGLHAFAYGVLAWIVLRHQGLVYREHWLTHFSTTLFGGLIQAAVFIAHGYLRRRIEPAFANPNAAAPLLLAAIYSAVAAVVCIGILQRLKRLFAFRPSRLYDATRLRDGHGLRR